MSAPGYRPTQGPTALVADLEFCEPTCPVCYVETCQDGTSRWCEGCGATWNLDGTGGEREPVDLVTNAGRPIVPAAS